MCSLAAPRPTPSTAIAALTRIETAAERTRALLGFVSAAAEVCRTRKVESDDAGALAAADAQAAADIVYDASGRAERERADAERLVIGTLGARTDARFAEFGAMVARAEAAVVDAETAAASVADTFAIAARRLTRQLRGELAADADPDDDA